MEHSSITCLTGAITKLNKLEELHAKQSKDLQVDIPEGIKELSQLKIFDLSYTSVGELPETFSELSNLHELQLQSCHALRNLRKLPGNLTDLGITVPVACDVKNLLEGLTKLEKLELHVQDADILPVDTKNVIPEWKFPDGLKSSKLPPNLSQLTLVNAKVHSGLCDFTKLWSLQLRNCDLRNVNNAGQVIGDSDSVFPKFLMVLIIDQCECPEELSFSGLKYLKQLGISTCEGLVEVAGLGGLESLEEISIQECNSLEKLRGDISKSEGLTFVRIEGNDELKEIEGRKRMQEKSESRPPKMRRHVVSGKNLPYMTNKKGKCRRAMFD